MDANSSRCFIYRNVKCCDACDVSTSAALSKLCQPKPKSSPSSFSKKTENVSEKKIFDDVTKVGASAVYDINQFQKCYACLRRNTHYQREDIVQKIRSLLKEIAIIHENKDRSMCDHCLITSGEPKCKICLELSKKTKTEIDKKTRQQHFKIWLCKVKQVLYSILEKETFGSKAYHDSDTTDELTRLLNELKNPLYVREPFIEDFPSIDSLENITESKDILEEVLLTLKSKKHYTSAATIPGAKYFTDKKENFTDDLILPPIPEADLKTVGSKKDKEVTRLTKGLKEHEELLESTLGSKYPSIPKTRKGSKEMKDKIGEEKQEGNKGKKTKDVTEGKASRKSKLSSQEVLLSNKVKESGKKKPSGKSDKDLTEGKASKKPKLTSEEALLLKMMKESGKKQREEKVSKPVKPVVLPTIAALPSLPTKPAKPIKTIVEITESHNTMECDVFDTELTEMVKGTKIVPKEPLEELSDSIEPLQFKVKPECPSVEIEPSNMPTSTTGIGKAEKNKVKPGISKTADLGKGIIRYMLSNREFIDKGWTQLPTTKIVRRMNIYKMLPTSPIFEWFERHKSKGIIYYDSGEKLAEIEADASGKLYYKNGKLAMTYFSSNEVNSGQRCVVYSSGEKDSQGRSLPITVLAAFDYEGNGVVYDHYGNDRIKYNQSEGMLFDKTIGAPGRWKWHNLNDPPVLLPIFTDKRVQDPCIQAFEATTKDEGNQTGSKQEKPPNLDMLAIELDNFLKEKAHKLLQEFKPFHIKSKAMKLNEQFALKILDQASINLFFRDGQNSMKFNLGMILINNEIVDTDTSEANGVYTPYDKELPKSQFEADIQQLLVQAKRIGRYHSKMRY